MKPVFDVLDPKIDGIEIVDKNIILIISPKFDFIDIFSFFEDDEKRDGIPDFRFFLRNIDFNNDRLFFQDQRLFVSKSSSFRIIKSTSGTYIYIIKSVWNKLITALLNK